MRNTLITGMLIAALSFGLSACDKKEPIRGAYAEDHQRMVKEMEKRSIESHTVINAMRMVPRHMFVPQAQAPYAYMDTALPIGYGQTILPPFLVAYMVEEARVSKNDKVLLINAGSGYQAAVLAQIARRVYAIEIVDPLVQQARSNLKDLGYANVFYAQGNGYDGWAEEAPFDVIMIAAAVDSIPEKVFKQLRPGGRMIVAFGNVNTQELRRLTKGLDNKVTDERLLPVKLSPLLKQPPKE